MKKNIKIFIILSSFTVLSSCDSFEKDFYNSIDQAEIRAIKNKSTEFDLSSITKFAWDSVLIIRGNESVPVLGEEIELILKRQATDLPILKDRFYFLQSDKTIIVKEIESGIFSHKPSYDIELCLVDSTKQRSWLSRQECNFKVMSNSRTIGNGTVFLFPPCNTVVKPDSLLIFQ